MSSSSDYYELLGVKRDATEVDIRAAYREAALRWHPDRNLGSAEQAEPMFERVTEAYEVLIDQQKRASYDQTGEVPAREDSSTDEDSPAGGRLGAALSVFESLFANPEAVKGHLNTEGVGPDAQPPPPADVGTAAGMRCEAGHLLQFSTASAGTCDRCGRPVQSGEKLLDCRSCNYYLCFGCHPVTRCPAGHGLQTSAAIVGQCSGCQRRLQKGDLVTDCRQCGWYVCAGCYPPAQCPGGHGLQPWANQFQGACDGCHRGVQRGEVVMDCRRCNWYLCGSCGPRDRGTTHEKAALADGAPERHPLPQCAAGHSLAPRPAAAGACDACARSVRQGEMVMDCKSCNYYLCTRCSPIKQCPAGHKLKGCMATAGACNGCGKVVRDNEMVLDCRACNWFLCGLCHLPRKG